MSHIWPHGVFPNSHLNFTGNLKTLDLHLLSILILFQTFGLHLQLNFQFLGIECFGNNAAHWFISEVFVPFKSVVWSIIIIHVGPVE